MKSVEELIAEAQKGLFNEDEEVKQVKVQVKVEKRDG